MSKPWKEPTGHTKALRDASMRAAWRIEAIAPFLGVDIDAIHYKRGAFVVDRRPASPLRKLQRIALSIRALEPA